MPKKQQQKRIRIFKVSYHFKEVYDGKATSFPVAATDTAVADNAREAIDIVEYRVLHFRHVIKNKPEDGGDEVVTRTDFDPIGVNLLGEAEQ